MNGLGPDPFVDGESSTQAHDGAEPEPWWGKQAPTYIAGYYKAAMCTNTYTILLEEATLKS